MEFQGLTGNFTEANVEALAIAVFKGEKPSAADLKELDKLTGGQITSTLKSEEIKGEAGDVALLRFTPKGSVKASRPSARASRISNAATQARTVGTSAPVSRV